MSIPGRRKAAVLLVSIGQDAAAEVFRHLPDDVIERLTVEMAMTPNVDAAQADDILKEALDTAYKRGYVKEGGLQFARSVLFECNKQILRSRRRKRRKQFFFENGKNALKRFHLVRGCGRCLCGPRFGCQLAQACSRCRTCFLRDCRGIESTSSRFKVQSHSFVLKARLARCGR